MCQRHSCCAILALMFVVVVALLQCVAVVTPFWVYVFDGSYPCYFGMWQTCYEGSTDGHYICTDVFQDSRYSETWFYQVQALAASGLVASLITMTLTIHQHCGDRIDRCVTGLLSAMSYITCIIIILSLVFFIRNVNGIGTVSGQTFNYVPYMSASVYASSGAVIFSMLAGSVFVIVAHNTIKASECDNTEDGIRPNDTWEEGNDGRISDRRPRSNKIYDSKCYF
ncbi:uncharacterized protein LOC132546263 [Ylistrum balloti]|uniref:uncharacterized protein LOC132546263 n=1 Tax=Ylistrum balloti TaxID=509963 RepID=UPI002905F688|nr:uncharacterized protein LOC132546263 [Ylistrum balloti]